jgi:hypothetical protein
VRRLVDERGLPAELVQAVCDAIPYESVPFRLGWEEWSRRREAGVCTFSSVRHGPPNHRLADGP